MTVNNEIGVKQPVHEIGKICRENKIHFHTDAAQAVGKIPVDVNEMNIDLLSISGHKIYGPKGRWWSIGVKSWLASKGITIEGFLPMMLREFFRKASRSEFWL